MITFISSVFPSPNQAQLNALYSWDLARIPVILLGPLKDPAGVLSRFQNVTHVPDVKTASDLGYNSNTPIISDMIFKACNIVRSQLVAFINGDIIVKTNFKQSAEKMAIKYGFGPFYSGLRNDVVKYDVSSRLENFGMIPCSKELPSQKGPYTTFSDQIGFEKCFWNGGRWICPSKQEDRITFWGLGDKSDCFLEAPVIDSAQKINGLSGIIHQGFSGDIFIGSKETFEQMLLNMPQFLLGRMFWDNWIHLYFSGLKKCYQCSKSLPIFHFPHGYDHVDSEKDTLDHNRRIFVGSFKGTVPQMVNLNDWEEAKI